MTQGDDNQAQKNIIDLKEARKRQKEAAKQRAKEARAAKRFGPLSGEPGQKISFWTVLQALFVLVMVYFLMKSCGGH